MRAFWVDMGDMCVSAVAKGVIATVKRKHGIIGADWKLWVHSSLVETGVSDTERGAKTQATCAAKEWILHSKVLR